MGDSTGSMEVSPCSAEALQPQTEVEGEDPAHTEDKDGQQPHGSHTAGSNIPIPNAPAHQEHHCSSRTANPSEAGAAM